MTAAVFPWPAGTSAALWPDPAREFYARGSCPDQAALSRLVHGYGVPPVAIYDPDPVLVARVVPADGGLFEWAGDEAEDALPCILFLARDEIGEASDIVAWEPTSGFLAGWLGRCVALGEDSILAPRLGERLPVFRTPLGWLRNRRFGLVLVGDDRACARRLIDVGTLQGEDAEHRHEMYRRLRMPPPVITSPRRDRVSA